MLEDVHIIKLVGLIEKFKNHLKFDDDFLLKKKWMVRIRKKEEKLRNSYFTIKIDQFTFKFLVLFSLIYQIGYSNDVNVRSCTDV